VLLASLQTPSSTTSFQVLQPEIRQELTILNPYSISQAIGLAKVIEDKLRDSKPKPFRPTSHTNPFNPSTSTPNRTTPTNSTPFTLPIKRLTPTQLQEHRAQGLCYNCDEKFILGHKCSTSRFLLLLDDPDTLPDPDPPIDSPTIPETHDLVHFHLSTQALTGTPSPQTLKFKGIIHNLPVIVLIDSGSSHNILQPRIANHFHLPIKPTPPFSVMVGNGAFINYQGLCPSVNISFQDSTFCIPFYLLPIEGADVVLGIEWLRTLGPITSDFSIPSIAFTHHNQHITLQATTTTLATPASYHQFCQFLSIHAVASIHLLFMEPPSTSPLPLDISLQTPPINVKPYCYPHPQKDTISKLISEMLEQGFIKPSTSPFSSLVLLVCKKDGTWRFCVDYRALNAVTICDRFPIPTIDELLDELGSATVFI